MSRKLLYTTDSNDNDKLKSVTPAGVIATIGSGGTEVDGAGVAHGIVNGILYATGRTTTATGFEIGLYTVDTGMGVATLIGSMRISTPGSEKLPRIESP